MWTLVGEDTSVAFDFTFEGQFVLPDEGSVKLTVRNNDGIAFPGWNRTVQEGVKDTTLTVTLPAELNVLSDSQSFETRYVRVEYTVDGQPRSATKHYRVSPFIPLQSDEGKVRARLGASSDEIPDDQIDLISAYYKLVAGGELNLSTALKSNSAASLAANNAVEIKAALEHLPALAAKMAQSESQDNATRVRMKLDIPALRRSLLEALAEELTIMNDLTNGGSTASLPVLMVLTSPTNSMTS